MRIIDSSLTTTLQCSPGKESIFAWPKMIVSSWPKVVRPFDDGSDVTTSGLSIGELSDSTVSKMDLLRLLIL